MKKGYMYLLLVGMLLLSACSYNEKDVQTVSLEGIDNLYIDHGSTTVEVETADIESLEASLLMYRNGAGIVIDEGDQKINIRLESDISRMLNIGKMPRLLIRIPNDYARNVTIDGSSGNVNVKNLHTPKLDIKGKSGNVHLNLEDKQSNVKWLLQSGSGRRTVAFPLDNSEQSNRKTQGQTGDGSFSVQIQSTSGNIAIQ